MKTTSFSTEIFLMLIICSKLCVNMEKNGKQRTCLCRISNPSVWYVNIKSIQNYVLELKGYVILLDFILSCPNNNLFLKH